MRATIEKEFQHFDLVAGDGQLWRVEQFVIFSGNHLGVDLGRAQQYQHNENLAKKSHSHLQ
jgi:hypothetical protein